MLAAKMCICHSTVGRKSGFCDPKDNQWTGIIFLETHKLPLLIIVVSRPDGSDLTTKQTD